MFSQAVANDPEAIAALIARIEALEANAVTVALDMLGGAATLICAMLAEAGIGVVHTPGLAVNRARQGARGGETKSDPKDAAVIVELARARADLRPVEPGREIDAELRLLVSRRRDLVVDQTRRASRICELMSALFPALERRVDVTTKTGLVFLSLYAAPDAIRAAGAKRIARRVLKASANLRGVEALAETRRRPPRRTVSASPALPCAPRWSRSSPARRWPPGTVSPRSTAPSRRGSPATLTRPPFAACREWGQR